MGFGDVRLAEGLASKTILDACEAAFDQEFIPGTKNRDNCSGFVKGVAKLLFIPMPETANADGLVEYASANWTTLKSGSDARLYADCGVFVIAGLKGADHSPARSHGHVVVIVPGELYNKVYPKCWGGSLGSAQSKGNKSVGEVWNQTDRKAVGYYAALL